MYRILSEAHIYHFLRAELKLKQIYYVNNCYVPVIIFFSL